MTESYTGKTATAKVRLVGDTTGVKPAPSNFEREGYGTAHSPIFFVTNHDQALEVTGQRNLSWMFTTFSNTTVTYSVGGGTDKGGSASLIDPNLGSFRYTPPNKFAGWDSFDVTATDDNGASDPQKVYVLVYDRVPQAQYQEYATASGVPVSGQLDAYDPDDTAFTFKGAIWPAHGKLDLGGDGSFTYTPDADFAGTDAFTYYAKDGIYDGGLATVYIDVAQGTGNYVSIEATDPVATEGADPADTATFTISRTDTTGSLDVNYVIDRLTTASASDYAIVGTAHFEPGDSQVVLEIDPNDDTIREWTETVVARLKPGAGYTIYGATTAEAEIVDTDAPTITMDETIIRANNDDDNGNQVPDLSDTTGVAGEDDLVPLGLEFPQDVKPGAQVTLTATTTMVSVWSDQTKSQLLIAYPDTARTWVVGRDAIPSQVWVEGLEGSSTVDDITFVLSDTDATADQPPQNPTNTSGEKDASGIKLSIVLNTLDQGVNRAQDVTGRTQDWLIGEMVDAYVSISCPPELRPQDPTYDWTVPGDVLRDYVVAPDASFANAIALADKHGGTENEPLNGKKQSAITYFWKSTASVSPDCDTDPVTVTLGNVPGGPATLKTTFRVFTPVSAATVTDFGTGSLSTALDKVGLFMNGAIPGITMDATVEMPNGAAPGQFFFLQKMNRRRSQTVTLPDQSTQGEHLINYGQWGLDE